MDQISFNKFVVAQFLPFNIADPAEVIFNLGLTAIFFLILRFCTRRAQANEIDTFLVANVSISFTLALLIGYVRRSDMRIEDATEIFLLTGCFYFTVLVMSWALRFEELKSAVRPLARQVLLEDRLRDPILIMSFLVLAPVTFFFAAAIQEGGEGSSVSIVRGAGLARFLSEGLSPFFIYYAFSVIVVSGRLRNWLMLLVIVGAGPLLGSKASILTSVVSFLMVWGLYKPEMRFKQAVMLLPLLPVALATMIVPLILFGKSPASAILQLASRFFLSGDIYFWMYVGGRPENFFGYYEWSSYLMHPFIAFFGQRGYDLPLGAALLGHAMGSYTLGGPNPHAPALGLVLFHGSLLWTGVFCVALGMLVTVLRYIALRAYCWTRLPPYLRSALFVVFFPLAPALFIDLGTTQRMMFSALVFAILFFLIGVAAELGLRRRILPSAV